MKTKNIKVIFDTNVWVSFLIGKRLAKVKHFITSGQITIITTDQLISELIIITNREKNKKVLLLSKGKCYRIIRTFRYYIRKSGDFA